MCFCIHFLEILIEILGPDKEVTEKTVFECLARLNESVDKLLTVKAYFDYRQEIGAGTAHAHAKEELPPIDNPFLGNLEKQQGPKKTAGSGTEAGADATQKSLILDKDLPYCQLQGEKKTCDAGRDDDRSSVLVDEARIRKSVTEKIKTKSGAEGTEISTSDSAAFRYFQSLNSAARKKSSGTSQVRFPMRGRRPYK